MLWRCGDNRVFITHSVAVKRRLIGEPRWDLTFNASKLADPFLKFFGPFSFGLHKIFFLVKKGAEARAALRLSSPYSTSFLGTALRGED